jgi:hypothetical protein
MAEDTATWFQRWSKEMASGGAPGGRIDRGPLETVASVPGRQAPPKRGKAGSRVPSFSEAQVRKKGGIR